MILPRLFLLLAIVSLAACGESTTEQPSNLETAPPAAETPAPEPPAEPAPGYAPVPAEEELSELARSQNKWTGDLDVMEERRVVRMLTVYSNGKYFIDKGEERGLVKEMATRFEDFLNKRLGRKTVRIHVAIIPVARNRLIPALLEGRGDVINGSLSITGPRDELVDFSIPVSKPPT